MRLHRMVSRALRTTLTFSTLLVLTACGTARKPVEMVIPTDPFYPSPTQPPLQVSKGSLFQPVRMDIVTPHKAQRVGDILIVVLDENIRSTTAKNTNLDRSGNVNVGVPTISGLPFRSSLDDLALDANASMGFKGQGATNTSNRLQGQISVTVRQVLDNGNLIVAGEKQIGNNIETESVKISGTVDPKFIRNRQISSSEIADARLEYVGSGSSSNASSPGWFTDLLLYFNPF